MRSFDYVVKRIAFAFATIFVAVTLNFVIFRAAPGDATTALRCLSCTDEVRAQVRTELGLDKSKWQQYRLYLRGRHGQGGACERFQHVRIEHDRGPLPLSRKLRVDNYGRDAGTIPRNLKSTNFL